MTNNHSGSTFKTESSLPEGLSNKIAYLYCHRSLPGHETTQYTYYPHYRYGLTFYFNATVALGDRHALAHASANSDLVVVASVNHDRAVNVTLRGRFVKYGIAFQPLGMNRFFEGVVPLIREQNKVSVAIEPSQAKPLFDFLKAHHDVFVENAEAGIQLLISYFASAQSHSIPVLLEQAVQRMIVTSGADSVEALAKHFGVGRKQVYRVFKSHLGCGVDEYRKLVKFRNALNHYRAAGQHERFTDLALAHNYYDQPAFVKHFKSITGKAPRLFFEGLSHLGMADTYWTLQ